MLSNINKYIIRSVEVMNFKNKDNKISNITYNVNESKDTEIKLR